MPNTRKKETDKIVSALVRIDNSMKLVYELSGGRQRISFYKELPFEILSRVDDIIKDHRVIAGRSWSFHMANCTITIRRKFNT